MATATPQPAPSVTPLSGDADHSFALAVATHVASLALAIDNPRALAEKTLEWIKATYPSRVYTAYWVTLTKDHQNDKGIVVDIAQLPWSLRLRALVGGWSGGLGVFTPDYSFGTLKVSIGVGAVISYDHLSDLQPVAAFAVRF